MGEQAVPRLSHELPGVPRRGRHRPQAFTSTNRRDRAAQDSRLPHATVIIHDGFVTATSVRRLRRCERLLRPPLVHRVQRSRAPGRQGATGAPSGQRRRNPGASPARWTGGPPVEAVARQLANLASVAADRTPWPLSLWPSAPHEEHVRLERGRQLCRDGLQHFV